MTSPPETLGGAGLLVLHAPHDGRVRGEGAGATGRSLVDGLAELGSGRRRRVLHIDNQAL